MVRKIMNYLKTCTLEKYIMIFSIIAGTLFLIAAISGEWRYYFSTFICYASAVMVSEDKHKEKYRKTKNH